MRTKLLRRHVASSIMSDESRPASIGAMEMSEHTCFAPGCRAWGSFGYDRGRGVTDWWCHEHVPRDGTGERKAGY
jgi:hypothetical protein